MFLEFFANVLTCSIYLISLMNYEKAFDKNHLSRRFNPIAKRDAERRVRLL
jgi:hypothetical protein